MTKVIRDVDLRDSAHYEASIEWLRGNVVLGNKLKGQVLQLNVALPRGAVTLYMDTANSYIMAFRGTDGVYVLEDHKSESFKKALQSEMKEARIEILKGLGADHGAGGLKTFSDKSANGRTFTREDLDSAAKLSGYSGGSRNMTYEELRPHLSLLVCMIAESARIPMMEYDFSNMLYYRYSVWADEAIRSYDDAKYLLPLAYKAFPNYPRRLAVEKLGNRAHELDELLKKIQSTLGTQNRSDLVANLLIGRMAALPLPAQLSSRFRDICKELKISDPALVKQLISTARNTNAMRAAKQGVVIPPVV